MDDDLPRQAGARPREGQTEVRVRLSPILREALAAASPGEDLDEALLRALKARDPEHATALLSACTRMISLEAKRTLEDRERIIRRLAEEEAGPEIILRTSGGDVPRTVTESRTYRIGDREYRSLEEMPPELRRAVEAAGAGRPARRAGCLWAPLAALLRVLLSR